MLTTMTTTENLGFVHNFFSHPRINFVGAKQSCFKMKSDGDNVADHKATSNLEDPLDVAELLERIGLNDIEYDDPKETEPEWSFPETECTERASRHLSGGGLLTERSVTPTTKTSFTGRTTPTINQSSVSSEEVTTSQSTNPFKNHMRLVLEADEDIGEEIRVPQGSAFCPSNPFSKFNILNSSLQEDEPFRRRSASQCSTRAVSPESFDNPFFRSPRPNSFIFALPAPPLVSQATQTAMESSWRGHQSENDLHCLQTSLKSLLMSGWYYENVSWQDSILLLQDTEPGTFFVRDSADPNFLFSLSLQTARGPTSVRLHYVNGRFRLDAETKLIPNIPSFNSVIDLIEYYVANTDRRKKQKTRRKTKEQVWVDVHGQVYSNILLSKPLLRHGKIPQLKHMCRLQVNSLIKNNFKQKCLKSKDHMTITYIPVVSLITSLKLPQPIENYLIQYPFSV